MELGLTNAGGCYGEYHQVAYGNSPYGLRPWKGMVDMTRTTVDPQSLLDMEALERSPELIKELRSALRYGRPVTVSHTKVIVEPLEGLDKQGYPVWGKPEKWSLIQDILDEIDDVEEGKMVQVGPSYYSKEVMCV